MADAAQVGITITARDKTAPGFASASKGAEVLEKKFSGLGGVVKTMPEKFSKVQGAMMVMGGAMGEAGGKAAEVGAKISGLAGLLLAGGPFGVGLAVAIGLLAAFQAALEKVLPPIKEIEGSLIEMRKLEAKVAAEGMMTFEDWMEAQKVREDTTKRLDAMKAAAAAKNTKIRDEEDKGEKALADARKKENDDAIRRIENRSQFRQQKLQADADLELELAREQDDKLAEIDEKREARAQAIAAVVTDLSRAAADIMIADSERSAAAARKAFISRALDKIQAAAASGAASAAEGAVEEFPYPYNLIVAAVASAAVYTAIAAFRAKVIGAATGGLITGGTRGRDSVPAMLMPGEVVVRAPIVQEVERRMLGGAPGTSGGGATYNIIVNASALDADSLTSVARRKLAVKLGNDIEGQHALGRVRRGRR